MLSTKNICVLLLICVAHLGCSSSYRYQMERGGGDTEGIQSTSEKTDISGAPSGSSNIYLMHEKIKKFLDEESSKEGSPISKKPRVESPVSEKVFKKGSFVSDSEINEIIKELGKSIDIPNTDKEYNEFLNKYGCIYGEGFQICGCPQGITDSKVKIEHIVSIQRGFDYRCEVNKIKEERRKLCWLIAKIDQGDQYYINFSKNKEWLIYSMSLDGKSKPFAKNFLDFLDKFFEAYKIKSEESYEEESD